MQPVDAQWDDAYHSARRLLAIPALRNMITASYAGAFVDEYQDCSILHHSLILELATIIPCRVLGDPLQGIFDFDGAMVDWKIDVLSSFPELPPLKTPHRWATTNPRLGVCLAAIRTTIEQGDAIDFRRFAPIKWRQLPIAPAERLSAQREECLSAAKQKGDVVALRKWAPNCYKTAEGLNGAFTCMEEIDCKDLFKHAKAIGQGTPFDSVAAFLSFAQTCMTGIAADLRPFRIAAERNATPSVYQQSKLPAVAAAVRVIGTGGESLLVLARAIERLPKRRIFRQELWSEMLRAIETHSLQPEESLADIAWRLRNQARRRGRSIARRTLSRTLLVKGLQFDHCVVLDAEELNAKNLYVALTRPQHSLLVCSSTPVLTRPL
jgi:DNA helicase-2/ATP-dependent DNA helicase PcrA